MLWNDSVLFLSKASDSCAAGIFPAAYFFEIGYPPECPARDFPNGAWSFSTVTDGLLAGEHCEIISIFVEVVKIMGDNEMGEIKHCRRYVRKQCLQTWG